MHLGVSWESLVSSWGSKHESPTILWRLLYIYHFSFPPLSADQVITAGLDKKIMLWDFRVANGSNEQSKVVDFEVESMSVFGVHVLVVIGSSVEMYDLRRLKEPIKMKESSMDYRISCICAFPNCQGIIPFPLFFSFSAHLPFRRYLSKICIICLLPNGMHDVK